MADKITILKRIIIAIDGYSSCGKSSFAKLIAERIAYLYLDSGAMYRAFAWHCLQQKLPDPSHTDFMSKLPTLLDTYHIKFQYNTELKTYQTWLNGKMVEEEIRSIRVSEIVSQLSQIKEVRQKMVAIQREMGKQKGIVMDGRDIGTVVFPHAELKIFMTASVEIRAQRRYKELTEKGLKVDFGDIKKNIELRDYQDISRAESPLIKADDAVVLDNSHMTFHQQMEWFMNIYLNLLKKI